MTPDEFRAWQRRTGLKRSRAAAALAVSPRTVEDWLAGRREISATIARLCRYIETFGEMDDATRPEAQAS